MMAVREPERERHRAGRPAVGRLSRRRDHRHPKKGVAPPWAPISAPPSSAGRLVNRTTGSRDRPPRVARIGTIEDTEQNRRLRRHRVSVHEHEDGTITIHHAGRVLAHHAHPKDEARITQGAIVGNKHLADTLEWIAEQQRQRDRDRLAKPKITLREKKRIRMAADLTA